jgi:hypothetical protein
MMDRFTNDELDMLITAVIHALGTVDDMPEEDAGFLDSALVKLQKQRQAQD